MEIEIKPEVAIEIKIVCLLITLTALTQFIFVMGMVNQGNIENQYKVFWHLLWILNLLLIYGLWNLQSVAYYLLYLIGMIHVGAYIYMVINFFQLNQSVEIFFEIFVWFFIIYQMSKINIRIFYKDKSLNGELLNLKINE